MLIYFRPIGDSPSPSPSDRQGAAHPRGLCGPDEGEILIYFDLGDSPSPSPSEQ